ncbi:hypothetical protein [Rhodoligotrophos defluvii]|uniref:hypothetical protein n=1 Tax=Rhodoligotrophos defluvii TaxID=2561934 RepID=UPI0010C966AE|nr:hypothetical protein [Rhodoligotrophos defluvii]
MTTKPYVFATAGQAAFGTEPGSSRGASASRRPAPMRPTPPGGQCDAAVVEYIADMALSLRDMSAEANQPFLGYLLEMVFQEAHNEALKLRFAAAKQCAVHQA